MIRYNTSNDRICRLVIKWCKEKEYEYSFAAFGKNEDTCVYPIVIDAPFCSKKELDEMISKEINCE